MFYVHILATQLTSQLAALTAHVRPQDVVKVASLHQAMGITLHPSSSLPEDTPTPSPPPLNTTTTL